MIKKFLGLAICAVMAAQAITASAAQFSDLDAAHWAFSAVSTLVGEGTIKGYADGSFQPDNTVTRAEFVKMIGKGQTKRDTDFADVPTSHWGYDYIMYSGLDGTDSSHFEPDRPITRGETVSLLWKRAGAIETASAPEMITNQGDAKAVAWIYNYGVMVGNDGVNLRLGDTLSRAEAAALIIKSRGAKTPVSFMNTVSSDLLAYVFNSLKLFDDATYNPDATVTYPQLSRAMQRFATNEYNLSYSKYHVEELYEGEYAKDIYILGHDVLGDDFIKAEAEQQNASIAEAIAAFKAASVRRSHKSINTSIVLYKDGEKALTSLVTQKEIAAILLQYDAVAGSQVGYISGQDERNRYQDVIMSLKTTNLPANADDFQAIADGIPLEVYEYPFTMKEGADASECGNPKANFDFAREYSSLFMLQCDKLQKAAKEQYGSDIKFTYYPNLAYDTGSGFAMRLKCEIISKSDSFNYPEDLFSTGVITNAGQQLQNGSVFYVEVLTDYAIFQ